MVERNVVKVPSVLYYFRVAPNCLLAPINQQSTWSTQGIGLSDELDNSVALSLTVRQGTLPISKICI